MKVKDLEDNINLLDLIGRDYPGQLRQLGSGNYRLDPCPICNGKDHFTIYSSTNSYSSFSDCCQGGSIFKYLTEVRGLSEEAAKEELKRMNGIHEGKKIDPNISQPTKVQDIKEPNFKETLFNIYNTQTEEEKQETIIYLTGRGILIEELDTKYKPFIATYKGCKRLFIPYIKEGEIKGYNARAIGEGQPKYIKAAGMKDTYFNIDTFKDLKEGEPVFICEGEIDCLSLQMLGLKAIAIGGSNNARNIKGYIEKKGLEDSFIVAAFDNDKAGQEAAEELGRVSLKIPGKFKDINEWYLGSSREEIKGNIRGQIDNLRALDKRPDNTLSYLNNNFIEAIESTREHSKKKTGFKFLDKHIKLLPGLITLGGASGLGKTTLAYQIADQLAEQGEEVIFFSLEMGKFEMVTKSINRYMKINNPRELTTATDIKLGNFKPGSKDNLAKSIKQYSNIAKKVSIVEGNFNSTVEYMREYINEYIEKNKCKPVIFIDYLQMIPCSSDKTDMERLDNTVVELKRISRDLDITIFVISSLNRSNYQYSIAFESFKGSGSIEYTSDIVLGLQLSILNEEDFISEKNITRQRELIEEAMGEYPRKIDLVGLKNRNGTSNFKIPFDFYAASDLFEEQPQRAELRVVREERL